MDGALTILKCDSEYEEKNSTHGYREGRGLVVQGEVVEHVPP